MADSARIVSIQALRGLAALLVCIGHAFHEAAPYSDKAARLEQLPWGSGVDLFFLISGFVMMLTTDKAAAGFASAKEFLWRRVIRIVPVYWAFTGLMFISMLAFPESVSGTDASGRHLVLSAFFIPHVSSDGGVQPLLKLGWTLNLEFMFYALFAVCMFVRPVARFPLVLAGLWGVFGAASAGWFWPGANEAYRTSALFEFGLGMALYLLFKSLSQRRPIARLAWLGIVLAAVPAAFLLAWMNGWHSRFYLWGVPMVGIFLAVHLIGESGRLSRGLGLAGKLGDASYALYLSHPFAIEAIKVMGRKVGWWGAGASEAAGWMLFIISVLASVAGGFLVYYLFEKPFLGWSKRLRMRPPQASAPMPAA